MEEGESVFEHVDYEEKKRFENKKTSLVKVGGDINKSENFHYISQDKPKNDNEVEYIILKNRDKNGSSRLNDHLLVHIAEEREKWIYPYAQEGDLEDFLKKNALNFSKDDIVLFANHVGIGTSILHSLGYSHGDLSLTNVLVSRDRNMFTNFSIGDFSGCHKITPEFLAEDPSFQPIPWDRKLLVLLIKKLIIFDSTPKEERISQVNKLNNLRFSQFNLEKFQPFFDNYIKTGDYKQLVADLKSHL